MSRNGNGLFATARSVARTGLYSLLGLVIPTLLCAQTEITENSRTVAPELHPIATLANHVPSPFLIHGMTFDDPALQMAERSRELYEQALKKHPDLISCIQEDGFADDEFDINAFVWRDFSYNQDFAVCIFWIADFLRDAQEMVSWFEAQGFHSVRTVGVSYAEIRHMGALRDGSSVSAGWQRRENEFPFGVNRIPTAESVLGQSYALSLEVIFSNEGSPLHISYGFVNK